jgi:hypothetical protein
MISENKRKDDFMYICVDVNRDKIPRQVDKVPAVLLTNGKALFEDDIYRHIQATDDVMPVHSNNMDGFAFLDESTQGNQGWQNFAAVGMDERIHCVEEENKPESGEDNVLDKYKMERDMDISKLFKDVPRT